MIYIKVLDDEGRITSVEALDPPVYVYVQPKNGAVLRCLDHLAQGVLSADCSVIYQLEGEETLQQAVATAAIITAAEYYELESTLDEEDDPEDTNPEISEDTDESAVMTRAELTNEVAELKEQLAAAKILLGVE